jgi:hypothetical protein
MKRTVSTRAVEQRVDRALNKEGAMLRKSRPRDQFHQQAYLVISTTENCNIGEFDDLEDFAREKGALKPWEALASPPAD